MCEAVQPTWEALPSKCEEGPREQGAIPRGEQAAHAGCGGRNARSDVLLVPHARSLAGQVAQVEEAGTADDALADHLDLLDARRVRQEDALDPDVEADLAHGERAAGPGAVALDDHPLEHLGA